MKKKTQKIINKFVKATSLKSTDEVSEFNAIRIQLEFLTKIEHLMKESNITKKELADGLNISKKELKSIFRADVPLTMTMLGKIEDILKIGIEIDY